MAVGLKEAPSIPPSIVTDLNPKWFTIYHADDANWNFDPSKASDAETEVAADVENLFYPSQQWKIEAVSSHIFPEDQVVGMHFGMHTRQRVPTKWARHGRRFMRHLSLEQTLDQDRLHIETEKEAWELGYAVYIKDDHPDRPLPKMGPFVRQRTSRYRGSTPYYIDDISVQPFFGYDPLTGKVVGEDTSRLIVSLILVDQLQQVQNRIAAKLLDREKEIADLEQQWRAIPARLKSIRMTSPEELVRLDRQYLEALKERSDPFAQLKAPNPHS